MALVYRARRMVKAPRLTVRAKLVQRHNAQKHINGPLGQWQHVIFCDESPFMLFRIYNRIRVRRLVVEAMNEDCIYMVMWLTEAVLCMYVVVSPQGYLSYGKNFLVRSGSDVTGAIYRRVLEEHFVPHGRAWYRNNWLLADDNARPNRACV